MKSLQGQGRSSAVVKNRLLKVRKFVYRNEILEMQISLFEPIIISNLTGRAKIAAMSADLKLKYGVLESALSMVFCYFD
jgi:hypothetical protein